jgi:ectoine hydroxylase-related dioxygenase (phytanoyl-CoA dioxygenase family)
MKLTPAQARAHADEVRETSVTVLKGLIPADVIDTWKEAFGPLLAASIRHERDRPNRGPHRYYVTLPFHGLWADPAVIDNDAIMAVVEELVGADGVMCQLATDTPLLGSEQQELHRDTQLLFPESGAETPPYQLAVNFPLVDVTDETGPMEYAPGTHILSKEEGMARIERGEIPLVKAYMARGDVMIRDVRHIHRGTPNRSATPRPMVVIGYSRRWLNRPEVDIRIPADVLVALPERARRWLRHNPVFESRAEADRSEEAYRAFAY